MKIGIFGGSFDPVHSEHVRAAEAAKIALGLDEVFVLPSYRAPHKESGARASGEDRLEMCRIAFSGVATVSAFEVESGGTSYTYLTCRHFAEKFPQAELYFLVGADMLEDFFTWKNPDDILAHVTLAAFARGEEGISALHEKFKARFGKDFVEIPFRGEEVSSTEARIRIAFGKEVAFLPAGVSDYVKRRGLYTHPAIAPALALEKEERREHSFRVAVMAVKRAKSLHISEEKALLASALHDCGKYVPLDSPLLAGFTAPEGVPAPVLHQYTGAYLAEYAFGVTDEEVLDAIRYHTSGREDMAPLGKLVFLADMLEEGRAFEGVERLREAFWRDLDECLLLCFEQQNDYLRKNESKGQEIYSLTRRAYEWAKRKK